MGAKLRILELLGRDELDKLEAFAREPGRTVDEIHDWMLAQGYTLSRNAAWNWKKDFDATDKFKASNDVARSLIEAAKSGGTVEVTKAANLQMSSMLFEAMLAAQTNGNVDSKTLLMLSAAVKNNVAAARENERLKLELTAALNEADKAAKTGASGEAVVNKVREILGIKPAA